jgi:hypothetical protein
MGHLLEVPSLLVWTRSRNTLLRLLPNSTTSYCIDERILKAGETCDHVVEANVTGREIFQETAEALAEYKHPARHFFLDRIVSKEMV